MKSLILEVLNNFELQIILMLTFVLFCCILIFKKKKKKKRRLSSKKGFVYFLEDPESKQIKIGVSVDVERRIRQLNTGNIGHNIKLLKKIYTKDMFKLEKKYHQKFAKYRKAGEWFDGRIKKMI